MPDPAKNLLNVINKVKTRISSYPPIVIWQMGKVGSSSVYESLKSLRLANPIFHIHFLNPANLNRVRNEFNHKELPVPRHIKDGEMLLERYRKAGGKHWKIITIVRELSKIKISGFFENIQRLSYDHEGLITEQGEINTELTIQLLKNQFNRFDETTDYVCTWFDKEINQMLNIDVFSHPFDHEKGYTIIKNDNISLLILKNELLNSTFEEAITSFLNIDFPIKLKNTNISEKKYYSKAFGQVRNDLTLSPEIKKKINATKYMRHFYLS